MEFLYLLLHRPQTFECALSDLFRIIPAEQWAFCQNMISQGAITSCDLAVKPELYLVVHVFCVSLHHISCLLA